MFRDLAQEGPAVPLTSDDAVERATGIEPAFSAWEADVLPLNYARSGAGPTLPGCRRPGGQSLDEVGQQLRTHPAAPADQARAAVHPLLHAGR